MTFVQANNNGQSCALCFSVNFSQFSCATSCKYRAFVQE